MSRKRILYDRKGILHDASDIAFVLADVRQGEYSPHSLHQIFDICAEGNIDFVNRILDLGIAEVENTVYGHMERKILTCHRQYSEREWRLIKASVHEYLVAKVIAEWLVVAVPAGAAIAGSSSTNRSVTDHLLQIWKERVEAARSALEEAVKVQGGVYAFCRRISPI